MRAAFHFDAEQFGIGYGFPATALFFRHILTYIALEQRHLYVRRGDFPFWDFNVDSLPALARRIFDCERPIWSSLTHEALTSALQSRRVWVLAVEGLSPSDARCVDSRLSESAGYLGAIEIHLANRTHWGVYDHKLVAPTEWLVMSFGSSK